MQFSSQEIGTYYWILGAMGVRFIDFRREKPRSLLIFGCDNKANAVGIWS